MSNKILKYLIIGFLGMVIFSPELIASETGMPWEGALKKIVDSLTGPVAFAFSVVAVMVAAVAAIMRQDTNDWIQKVIWIALVVSLLAFVTSLLATLFGISGTVI